MSLARGRGRLDIGRVSLDQGVGTLGRLLLALFLAAGPGPGSDALRARRLFLAGRDQEAVVRSDSALSLYRAARRADPAYLPAQIAYITLMRKSVRALELIHEFRPRPGDTSATALCLAMEIAGSLGPLDPALTPRLERLGSCGEFVLGGDLPFPDSVTLRFGARAGLAVPQLGQAWSRQAETLERNGRWREARVALEEGIRQVPHVLDRLSLYAFLEDWYLQRGDTTRADALRRSVYRAVARDGRPGVLLAYLGMEPATLERSLRIARIARAAGGWLEEWHISTGLAHDYVDLGQPQQALVFANRAVALADSVGRPGPRLVAYTRRGRAYVKAGRTTDAIADLTRAVRLEAFVRPWLYPADAWHNLAHAYEGQGQFVAASVAADHFMVLAESTAGSERMESLLDAGLIRWKAGRRAESRAAFEAMVHWVDVHHAEHYWAGEYLERIGDLRRALIYYRAGAATNHQEVLNLKGEVRVYQALGYSDSAESAARAHDTSDWLLPNEVPLMPRVLVRQGRRGEAWRIAQSWAERQRRGGNIQGEALARLELAELLIENSQPRPAVIAAARAETLALRLSLTDELIGARRERGVAMMLAGDTSAALPVLKSAATLALAHPTVSLVVETQTALGDALASHPFAALAAYGTAAAAIGDLTVRLDEDLDRAGYRERHLAPFDGAIRVLLRSPPSASRTATLLQWSERRKGAALALATQVARAGPSRPGLDVREIQTRLGRGEALIDYTVEDGATAAVVVTRTGARTVELPVTRDSLSGMVERLRGPLSAAAGRRIDLARAPFDLALAHALYQTVMAPLGPSLAGIDHLLIVPDGPLHHVSFEALVASTPQADHPADYSSPHYVIDDFTIEYLPAAEFLTSSEMRSRSIARSGRLLAVVRGVEGGARELNGIRSAWSASRVVALQEQAATESAVRRDMAGFPLVHFAVHATADARDPLASRLSLAPDSLADGLLRMNEIASQRTHARLVVLSACETQVGRNYGGEGVMSLARGFLLSGAETVVATRWPVGPSAADVTAGFYGKLAKGASPSDALRFAQLALRRNPRLAHPFYWAGFVLLRG